MRRELLDCEADGICGSPHQEWNRLVGELAALKLLTNFDRAALAAYCGAHALWAEATQAIQKAGLTPSRLHGTTDP